jgi:frataxin
MDEKEFDYKASQFIHNLAELIEDQYEDLEVEIYENILYITTAAGQWVINKHSPTKQIWISSPKSGAFHFYFSDQLQTWLDTKSNSLTINQYIEQELNEK